MRLLIVDSDRDMVEMLTSWLKTLGHDVQRAYTGERAKSLWLEQEPDMVIVDTALNDMDGLGMCRDMRVKHDALVLVMADGKDVHDEIRCLESGADDYLSKPFLPGQLLAHMRAMSRRVRSTLERRPSAVVSVGPICIDSMHNEVTVYGKVARLTPTESKLLHLLAMNANDVCSSEQIVNYVWGYDESGDACLIKAHIRHLRQKVEPDPGNPQFILTVPGVGYTLIRQTPDEEVVGEGIRSLRVISSRN